MASSSRYNIGFTGTRSGLTQEQSANLATLLLNVPHEDTWFHHGDCVGSDAQAAQVAKQLGYQICIHPPLNQSLRAHCEGDLILPEADYLERDREIVLACEELIATPKEMCKPEASPTRGSGTWYTIRHALKLGRKVTILYPNGSYAIYRNGVHHAE